MSAMVSTMFSGLNFFGSIYILTKYFHNSVSCIWMCVSRGIAIVDLRKKIPAMKMKS
jgi:hypothetical protein